MKLTYKTRNNKLRDIDLTAPFWKLLVVIITFGFFITLISVMIIKTADAGLDNYYLERQQIVEYYEGAYE